MKFTKLLTKQYFLTILFLAFLTVFIIPYPTIEVPEWKILVIDENYLPGKNMAIEQKLDNRYYGQNTVYNVSTDKNGFAVFPARYQWAGIARRVVATFWRLLGYDTGSAVEIRVSGDRCRAALISWVSQKGGPRSEKLICP